MVYQDASADIFLTIMALLLQRYYDYPQIVEVLGHQITGQQSYLYPYRLFCPNPEKGFQRRVSNKPLL